MGRLALLPTRPPRSARPSRPRRPQLRRPEEPQQDGPAGLDLAGELQQAGPALLERDERLAEASQGPTDEHAQVRLVADEGDGAAWLLLLEPREDAGRRLAGGEG